MNKHEFGLVCLLAGVLIGSVCTQVLNYQRMQDVLEVCHD
jgi:hypothetical protein